MFRVIDKNGVDQIGFTQDFKGACDTVDAMNKACPTNEFNVIGFPVVYGPAYDRAKKAAAAANPVPGSIV